MLGVIFCVILGATESQFFKIIFKQTIVMTQSLRKITELHLYWSMSTINIPTIKHMPLTPAKSIEKPSPIQTNHKNYQLKYVLFVAAVAHASTRKLKSKIGTKKKTDHRLH